MKLEELFEKNYVTDPAPADPELTMPSQYDNKNYGKPRKAKRFQTTIKGGGNIYSIKHWVQ